MKPQAQLRIHQFNQSDLTHNYHLNMDLERQIREAATPVVSLMLGKWKLIDVRKDGDNMTIRVMINEKDQSMQSLSRRPNGTLEFRKQEKPQDSTPNFSGSTGWENELEHRTQEEILKIAFKVMGSNTLRQEILNPNASLQAFVKQLAANIIEKAIIPMTDQDVQAWPVPAQQEDITYQNLRRNANEIARKRIVNPQIRTLANHLFNSREDLGPHHHQLLQHHRPQHGDIHGTPPDIPKRPPVLLQQHRHQTPKTHQAQTRRADNRGSQGRGQAAPRGVEILLPGRNRKSGIPGKVGNTWTQYARP